MNFFADFKNSSFNKADLLEISNKIDDKSKIYSQIGEIKKGIENYSFFSKYSYYKWPFWVNLLSESNTSHITPPILLNNVSVDCHIFSNFLSNDEVYIDPSGMVSSPLKPWSIEFWILSDNEIIRAQNKSIISKRDSSNSIISTLWKDEQFSVESKFYGAKSSIDELLLEVRVINNNLHKNSYLMMVIRPYNLSSIGGVNSISLLRNEKIISINEKKQILLYKNPDKVLTGNSEIGDISSISVKSDQVECENSMAVTSLAYKLKKGENLYHFRTAIPDEAIGSSLVDPAILKKEFIAYSKMRINKGIKIVFPDKKITNWFYGSKISLLNYVESDIFQPGKNLNGKNLFFIIFGYNRMGYLDESKNIISNIVGQYQSDIKKVDFLHVLTGAYIIAAVSDYFLYIRDIDYIREIYDKLKKIIILINNYTKKIKKISDIKFNSIPNNYSINPEYYDLILLSHSFFSFSYLSRCLGIFGDENKYFKEYEKLKKIFIKFLVKNEDKKKLSYNDNLIYSLVSIEPFSLGLSSDEQNILLDKISNHFPDMAFDVKSIGSDILMNSIIANIKLSKKDISVYDIILEIMNLGEKKYFLSEFMNYASKRGIYSSSSPKIVSSFFFSLLRNIIFIDNHDRLDIIPIPKDEWFLPGKEILIENAPSRFGFISFKIKSTENEVQFFFIDLPKFMPPDIMLNLPFRTKIIEGDDFIVKKSINNSHIINGWPEIIKCKRV